MSGLSSQYDPQAQLVQQQQAGLAGQETAAIAGADAAKNNAFRQNQESANSMGMAYSGQGLENNNRYIGERYAPAIAGIKQNTQQQGYQLQSALLGIRQQQGQQAYGMYNDQQNREQQQKQYEQSRNDTIAQNNRAYAQSLAQAAAAKSAQTSGFNVARDPSGGYAIKNANGQPSTLASYVQANGGGWNDVLKMLASGSKSDAKLADDLSRTNLSPQQLTAKYPHIFGIQ